MGNMSYCKFQNTVSDLKNCYESMQDSDLDSYEEKARKKIIDLCVDIAIEYGDEINRFCYEKDKP